MKINIHKNWRHIMSLGAISFNITFLFFYFLEYITKGVEIGFLNLLGLLATMVIFMFIMGLIIFKVSSLIFAKPKEDD